MIEWRRNTVLSKLARGMNQTEIAKELQLHPSTISLDVQYLKEQAKEELQTHISDRLPFEYNRAVTGINNILKKANETLDKATDTKTQLQTMGLLAELYKSIMSLATDGGIVERAMKMVKGLEDSTSEKTLAPHGTNTPTEEEEDLKEEE
jgi:predicted transcriptional regulator